MVFIIVGDDSLEKQCESLLTVLNSNVSLMSGQNIRNSFCNELKTTAPTLKSIIASVINLGCQPSSFLRLLYCKSHGFITTCRSFCPYCNIRLLRGCDESYCSARDRQEPNDKTETHICTHKRKTAIYGDLLTESMISIIGNMIQFGLIDQCIDVTRNQMAAKIRLCTRTHQLCITCGINNMQTLIALGEKDLADLLVSYYQEIKTPKECRSFLMESITNLNCDPIESQYFFASTNDSSFDDQQIIMEYMFVLRNSSDPSCSKEASTNTHDSSEDLVAEATDELVGTDSSTNTNDGRLEAMINELESLQRMNDAVAMEYSFVVGPYFIEAGCRNLR